MPQIINICLETNYYLIEPPTMYMYLNTHHHTPHLSLTPSHHHTLHIITPSHCHNITPSHHHILTPSHHHPLTPSPPHTLTPSQRISSPSGDGPSFVVNTPSSSSLVQSIHCGCHVKVRQESETKIMNRHTVEIERPEGPFVKFNPTKTDV